MNRIVNRDPLICTFCLIKKSLVPLEDREPPRAIILLLEIEDAAFTKGGEPGAPLWAVCFSLCHSQTSERQRIV